LRSKGLSTHANPLALGCGYAADKPLITVRPKAIDSRELADASAICDGPAIPASEAAQLYFGGGLS
jgi:hypothetical protein